MKTIVNILSLKVFNLVAFLKGYRFIQVDPYSSEASQLYHDEAYTFPRHLEAEIERYKAGTLSFLAYHRGNPAGFVRMGDPKIVNRTYECLGIDKEGHHYEIQNLVVGKQYRDGAQFVMLGLVKKIYEYSVNNQIRIWSACSKRNVYLTMRRYSREIEEVPVNFAAIEHPVTQYLFRNKIAETYFTMPVEAFAPSVILKKTLKKLLK